MDTITHARHNAASDLALALVASSQAPLLVFDGRFVIINENASFRSVLAIDPDIIESIGPNIGNGERDVPQLRALLRAILAGNAAIDAYELNLIRDGHETARIKINAQRLDLGSNQLPMIALTVTDVTSARLAKRPNDELVQERQALLQEIQLRLASSLQIIAGLLKQSERQNQSKRTPDPASLVSEEVCFHGRQRTNLDLRKKYPVGIRFAQVQAAIRERARRNEHLPPELFAEPGWDILLQLYAFHLLGGDVCQSELAPRLNVPDTTLGRWLKVLEAAVLISRKADVANKGDVRVKLTRKGLVALNDYFEPSLSSGDFAQNFEEE